MERHTFLSVLAVTLIALAVAIFLPSGRPPVQKSDLPWSVTVDGEGQSHLFGLTLGRSTVGEVMQRLREPAEVTMFVSAEGKRSVEVYFDRAPFGELSAKAVVGVGLDDETLRGMFERGIRISSLAGGLRKVELSHDDLRRVNSAPIASITYLPAANLDAEVVRRRFGEPVERMRERESELEHWLYPAIGLDLTLDAKGKEVLLYVKPSEFEKVVAPLKEKAEVVSAR